MKKTTTTNPTSESACGLDRMVMESFFEDLSVLEGISLGGVAWASPIADAT